MKLASNNPARCRRRHASRCVILCSLLAALVTVGTARAASSPRRDLLVHAGSRLTDKISPIWVAMVEPPAKEGQLEKTVVLAREEIGDKKWQQMPDTPARVIGLTGHGTELVVLIEGKDKSLEKRTWAWFSVDRQSSMSRFSYGPPLPQSVRLIALGGDRRSLYALGVAPADIGVARKPAVPDGQRSAAASSAPATQTLQPSVPTLFLLTGDEWTPMAADWPREAAGAAELASLHVIGDVPHVAVPTAQNTVRIYKFVRDPADWVQTHEVKVEGEIRLVKLLNNEDRPALWAQATDGLGSLWSPKYAVQKVQFSGATPKPEELDVTVSGDVRIFFRRDGKPYEQHFNWDGTPSGAAQLLDWTRPRTDPSLNLLTTVFMTVLAVLLVSTLLRRRNMNREDERGEPEE